MVNLMKFRFLYLSVSSGQPPLWSLWIIHHPPSEVFKSEWTLGKPNGQVAFWGAVRIPDMLRSRPGYLHISVIRTVKQKRWYYVRRIKEPPISSLLLELCVENSTCVKILPHNCSQSPNPHLCVKGVWTWKDNFKDEMYFYSNLTNWKH